MLYKDEAYAIVGAAMAVYNEMGHGFLEAVYQECLEIELAERGITFRAREALELRYRDHRLQQQYIPDLLCHDKIIVELKAVSALVDAHRAQVLNYLKATGMRLGLLLNFGAAGGLQFERMVL